MAKLKFRQEKNVCQTNLFDKEKKFLQKQFWQGKKILLALGGIVGAVVFGLLPATKYE